MKGEELSKTFMMIAKLKKPFGLHASYKNISALYGLTFVGARCVLIQ